MSCCDRRAPGSTARRRAGMEMVWCRRLALCAIALVGAVVPTPPGSRAAGDLSRQQPIVVEVELGGGEGRHVFEPSRLRFETGRLYRLVLRNNSRDPHYFTSDEFVARIFTRKVQVTQRRRRRARDHARRVQGRDPRDRGVSGTRGGVVVRSRGDREGHRSPLRDRRLGWPHPCRARHGGRDRHRIAVPFRVASRGAESAAPRDPVFSRAHRPARAACRSSSRPRRRLKACR